MKHLLKLDLSFSKTFDENHLAEFLENTKVNNSPLVELKLTSCSICSRLPAKLFRTLSLWRPPSCKLRLIDLSYNDITLEDRTELKKFWEGMYKTIARCKMKGKMILLNCA